MSFIHKLIKLHDETGLDDILLISPENIEYFLDIPVIADSVVALYSHKGEIQVYVPILEYYRFRDMLSKHDIEVIAVSKKIKPGDAKVFEGEYKDLFEKIGSGKEKIGCDISYTSPLINSLREKLGDKIVDISENITNYRMKKEDWELERIKQAIKITQSSIKAVASYLQEGITEAQLAGVFEHRARQYGVSRYAFDPIIVFNPGTSYPHNVPGTTKLRKPNMVLVDVGVKYRGRCSDLTRMILWGRPRKEWRKALEAVNEAIDAVIDKAEPGMTGEEIAKIAIDVIAKHGYRERFIHGLGHGIGVAVHEHPYLTLGQKIRVEPGAVFTIEPGIYIPGEFGVRIEEDAVMTKKGVKILSSGLERIIRP